jgi:hypothetical protein
MLKKIQQAVKKGNYDLTHHAVEEMAEDSLGIFDIEHAVIRAFIVSTGINCAFCHFDERSEEKSS